MNWCYLKSYPCSALGARHLAPFYSTGQHLFGHRLILAGFQLWLCVAILVWSKSWQKFEGSALILLKFSPAYIFCLKDRIKFPSAALNQSCGVWHWTSAALKSFQKENLKFPFTLFFSLKFKIASWTISELLHSHYSATSFPSVFNPQRYMFEY